MRYVSGRPDGKVADAIYASGQGGVARDMRYRANGLTSEDFAEADMKAKRGAYRGFQFDTQATPAGAISNKVTSFGGSFLVTEVIGTTAAITATPSLANGWAGVKNATEPTGAISVFGLTRKALSTPTGLRSTDNGTTWTTFTPTFDAVTNAVTLTNEPATNVVLLQYQAYAYQTEPAANGIVYGDIGGAWVNDLYSNAVFVESLINKVVKNNTGISYGRHSLTVDTIAADNKLATGSLHTPLILTAPDNDSPAAKALDYNVSIDQQAFKQYAATELVWGGSDWGDDSKVTVVDNESTLTDLNGTTVKVVTHRLREPIGWVKNTK